MTVSTADHRFPGSARPTDGGASQSPGHGVQGQSSRRTLVTTGVGNALEWYGWGIYSTFSIYFAPEIFTPEDPVASILGAMAIFAVAFLFRPLGGLLFGWIADQMGRRPAMLLTVGAASLGSGLIAIVPSYASAGLWAAAVLLVARIIQGLAYGGEMPTAQNYLSEAAPHHRRGRWASLIYVSGTIGILCGILMGIILDAVLPEQDMNSWGWRIPFAIGFALGLWAVIARRNLKETDTFSDAKQAPSRPPMWPEVRRNWRSSLRVIGLTVGGTVAYYVWAVSAIQQAVVIHGMPQGTALLASLLSNLVLVVVLPFWGALSDRIGRKGVLLIGNFVPALLFWPTSQMVDGSFLSLFIPATLMLVFLAPTLAINPAVFAEMFPTRIRIIGIAVPYATAIALFGGTAPALQNWAAANGHSTGFAVYVIVLLLISVAVSASLRETRGIALSH
ncbi:MFS transporter [Corynebacterium sp. 335C]